MVYCATGVPQALYNKIFLKIVSNMIKRTDSQQTCSEINEILVKGISSLSRKQTIWRKLLTEFHINLIVLNKYPLQLTYSETYTFYVLQYKQLMHIFHIRFHRSTCRSSTQEHLFKTVPITNHNYYLDIEWPEHNPTQLYKSHLFWEFVCVLIHTFYP